MTQMPHDPYCQVSLKSPNAITYLAFEFQKHFREREKILSTSAGPALIEGNFENDADLWCFCLLKSSLDELFSVPMVSGT